MYFCTYFDTNYLSKGKVCHYTLTNINKNNNLFILCLDNNIYEKVKSWERVTPILLTDMENFYPELLKIKNTRLLKEYFATITPILPLYIFEKYSHIDVLFYTDADIAFWSDTEEMIEVFGKKSIMVCDHGFEPPRSNVRFNVGILGYKNDNYCKSFLQWWSQKCIEWCEWITLPDGRMADQGYLNILHDDYDKYNALSCPHPGITIAPWNLSKHLVIERNNKKIVDFKYNLICYHYHEFRLLNKDSYYATGWKHTQSDKNIIYEPYFNLIRNM